MSTVAFSFPPELVEQIAMRAAEIVAERAGTGVGEWLSVAEVAEHLRCSTGRVYQLVSARRIPFEKDGSRTLFRRSQIDLWVEEGGARCP